jgi:hypothetical protein
MMSPSDTYAHKQPPSLLATEARLRGRAIRLRMEADAADAEAEVLREAAHHIDGLFPSAKARRAAKREAS